MVRWAAPDFTAAGRKHGVYHGGALRLPSSPIWTFKSEVPQVECKELLVNYYFRAPLPCEWTPCSLAENLQTKREKFHRQPVSLLQTNVSGDQQVCLEQRWALRCISQTSWIFFMSSSGEEPTVSEKRGETVLFFFFHWHGTSLTQSPKIMLG